jgi:hypothetical protein
MGTVTRELTSVFWATVDFQLATLGLTVVLAPAIVLGNRAVGAPLPDWLVTLTVGALVVGGAYPFVAGHWSLGRLGDFMFVLVAAWISLLVLAAIAIVVSGVRLSGDDLLPQAVVVWLGYPVAYWVVFRRGWRL